MGKNTGKERGSSCGGSGGGRLSCGVVVGGCDCNVEGSFTKFAG